MHSSESAHVLPRSLTKNNTGRLRILSKGFSPHEEGAVLQGACADLIAEGGACKQFGENYAQEPCKAKLMCESNKGSPAIGCEVTCFSNVIRFRYAVSLVECVKTRDCLVLKYLTRVQGLEGSDGHELHVTGTQTQYSVRNSTSHGLQA
jgi:hypothetical protein